ncbi:hypothetical protein Mapa_002396 [Marchantia paleacea]|nr:hypothetical protein Mapa_002396 [Marchantia paleacea]
MSTSLSFCIPPAYMHRHSGKTETPVVVQRLRIGSLFDFFSPPSRSALRSEQTTCFPL